MRVLLLAILLTSFFVTAAPDDEAYFKQFLYHRIDVNNDPDFPPHYQYFAIANDLPFDLLLPSKDTLRIILHLYLNEDGTYDALYYDFIVPASAQPGDSYYQRNCYAFHGTWAVPDKELLIKDANGKTVYIGKRSVAHGHNAVRFRFTPDFPVSELNGVEQEFVSSQSETPAWLKCGP